MSLLAYWISVAAMVALDHAMRTWTRLPHRWGISLGSVIAAFAVAWGVWLLVGRHGGLRTIPERRRYVAILAMILLAVSWFARRFAGH